MRFLFVCTLILALAAAGNAFAASLIGNGDFDALPDTSAGDLTPNAGAPVGGWQIDSYAETTDSVVTIGTIPDGGSRAMWIHGTGGSGYADKGVGEQVFSSVFTGDSDKLIVQYDETTIVDYISNTGAEIIIMDGGFANRGPEFKTIYAQGLNTIACYSDSYTSPPKYLGTYTPGETYRFRVSTDLETSSYDLFIRGGNEYPRWSQIGSQLPFRHTGANMPTQLDRVGFGKFTSYTNTYVDNVVAESSNTFYTGGEYANGFDSYADGDLLGQDGWRLGEGLASSAQVVTEGSGKAITVAGSADNNNRTSIYQDLDAIVESGTAHFTLDGKWNDDQSAPDQIQVAVGNSTMITESWSPIASTFGLIGDQFYAYNGSSNVLSGVSAAANTWYSFDATMQMTGQDRNTWSLVVSERDTGTVVWDTVSAGIPLDFRGDYTDVTRVGIFAITAAGSMTFDNIGVEVESAVEPPLPGDANLDGSVDVTDLGILATYYNGGSDLTWGQGDFTGDGLVNVNDLGILATHYGTSSVVASVPEPGSMALLACGGLSILVLSARRRFSRKVISMKSIVAFLVCVSLVALGGTATASLIVDGDFESLATGTPPDNATAAGAWVINADYQETSDSVITIDTAPGGGNALHVQGAKWTRGLAEQVFTSSYTGGLNKLVIEYDHTMIDDGSATGGVELYTMGGSFASRGPAVDFAKTGLYNTILYYSDGGQDLNLLGDKRLAVYTPGETYRLRVSTDLEANKFDLYIRGGPEYPRWKQIGEQLPFRHTGDAAPTYIDRISFGKFGQTTNGYVDNVDVFTTDDETGVLYTNNFESGYTAATVAGQNGWSAKEGELDNLQIVDTGAGDGKVLSMSSSSLTAKRAAVWQDLDTVAEAGEVHFKLDAKTSGEIANEHLQFVVGGGGLVSDTWNCASSFGFKDGEFYVVDGGGNSNVLTGVAYDPDTWYTLDATMWMSGIDRNYWKLTVTDRDTGTVVMDTDTVGLDLEFRTDYKDITRFGAFFKSDGGEMLLDNLELSMGTVAFAVPEPSVLMMLLCGFAGWLLLPLRRR